jgi:type II secretory pathway pseudopilin PulG
MKDNQSGRSMIEMLGVIAIIAVLTVGGMAGYAKAMEAWRINKTSQQISYIIAHIRALYRGQMGFYGLDSVNSPSAIDKTGAFPGEMGRNGSYTNPFAGQVTVKASGKEIAENKTDEDEYISHSDDMAFLLVYKGIPRNACVRLATTDWGTGSNGGAVAISINKNLDKVTSLNCSKMSTPSTSQTLGSMVICEGNGIMAMADASVGCSSESNNTLYFKLY